MSSITTHVTQCTIETLNQYNGIDGNNVIQQNTRIKVINNCDGPIRSFTGRGTELSDLSSTFNKHNIVVIHGVGGVGKTQLARKFAADNKNNYNCLFWLQAEFKEKLIKPLRELAIALAIEDAKDKNINQIRNEIYDILKTQRALLIFDNVLNETDIIEYLPPVPTELRNTKLHILITSQFLDWNPSTANCLPLIPLKKIHALELLDAILNTKRENAKDKEKLVRILEYMPLAIQIAASYIKTQMKQNDTFTITRYTEKLTNGIANIHKHKHIEYGKTLGMSIKMSLESLCETNSYAMELIYIMAFLNPDSITKVLLMKILKINSNDAVDDFNEAFHFITSYSLISLFGIRLYVHRNIQNIIRDDLTQLETHIFLKYYKLVLDYELNNEDQNSIHNTYVFKYAKDYTKFILQYYNTSKSAKLLQLLCEQGCLKNVKVIFTSLSKKKINFLIKQHGLLHHATSSSDIEIVKKICKYKIDINMKYGFYNLTSLHIACTYGYVDIVDFLIEKKANTNMKCKDGRTALHYASSGLHYDIVDRLLLRISAINVEERDKQNKTPLHLVLNTHNTNENNDKTIQIARLLVEKGANPDTANDDSRKVIHIAAHNGNYDFLAYLLNNYELDANAKDKNGDTPLFFAVAASKFIPEDQIMNTIKLLIENGANVETINNYGGTLLHIAALHCHNKIISYLLRKHNISINKTDSNGSTPLFYALLAYKSIPKDAVMATVKLLIENGASVESITNNGYGLPHAAAQYCRDQIISYLIQEHNISVDTPNPSGHTPLFYAVFANKSIPEADVMATVKLLIENGASADTITNNGSSLLHVAAEYCRDQIISYLIQEHNISVDTPNSSGLTPLFYALFSNKSIAENDVMATIKLLIENGASAETITNNGSSLLHVAAEYCRDQIISYLIQEHNISVDTPDSSGRTPLFHALVANKTILEDDVISTVKLLIKNGASVETITNDGYNLLHIAAKCCHYKIISYLIQEHKISIHKADNKGRTPLFRALVANKSISQDDVLATVKLLIQNGASVETITNDGYNLLHVASEYCHHKIIVYLIQEHKISIHKRDRDGSTPLFRALLAKESISEDILLSTVKVLIKNGASVETITNDGHNLLHIAAAYCHYKIISYLIQEHKISIHKTDNNGRTPLFCALSANKSISQDDVMAMVKLLIKNDARAETIANNGSSLLHVASEYCRDQIISYLIQEHNISVDMPDASSQTPLFYALFANKSIPEDDVMATVKLLIENGASTETIADNGSSLLHVAAEYCRHQIISYLIQEHNISVDMPDSSGLTPLFYALIANKSIPEDDVMATMKLLIENGASVESITNNGSRLLHVAAQYCRDQIMSYLIQEHNISVDISNPSGLTPLFYALLSNKSVPEDDVIATVKLLIENGATAETITNNGFSLLHVAAEYCREQIISYLIQEHNISVDTPNLSGLTPLFCALIANKSIPEDDVMATVKLLIENGASSETIANNGSSLLHVAAEYCRHQIISYLIQEHNISVDTPNSSGLTPLFYALFANKTIPEDDVMATVKLLIENGASAETITNNGFSLLHVAAKYCRDQIISYLIEEHNISVHSLDFSGLTPLLCTLLTNKSISENDVTKTIKLLISHGATVEAMDNAGCTILHYAAQCGRYQALTYLLHNYNININTKDEGGDTPLHCALIADESINQETVKKIIEILLLKGASINLKNKKDETALGLASADLREFILKSYNETSKTKIS